MGSETTKYFRDFLGGDRAAFEPLVEHLRPKLLERATKIVRSREEREDLLNEVFMALATYSGIPPDDVTGLAHVILDRLAASLARKNELRHTEPIPDLTPAGGWPSPFHAPEPCPAALAADADQKAHDLRAAREHLVELPDDQLEVVLLHTILGFPYREVAGVLGITVDNARQIHKRAIARLRARLEPPPGA